MATSGHLEFHAQLSRRGFIGEVNPKQTAWACVLGVVEYLPAKCNRVRRFRRAHQHHGRNLARPFNPARKRVAGSLVPQCLAGGRQHIGSEIGPRGKDAPLTVRLGSLTHIRLTDFRGCGRVLPPRQPGFLGSQPCQARVYRGFCTFLSSPGREFVTVTKVGFSPCLPRLARCHD